MKKRQTFREKCVLYYSAEDGHRVGHGLTTDQIGTGDCLLNALVDLIRAIDALIQLKKDDPDIELHRKAPAKICRMARTAKPMPRELYEIAHKRVRGEWPEEFRVEATPPDSQKFTQTIEEQVPA